MRNKKKPVGPVDLRTHRLNAVWQTKLPDSPDKTPEILSNLVNKSSKDELLAIVADIEAGKYDDRTTGLPLQEHTGPVSKEVAPELDPVSKLAVLAQNFKVALYRCALGVLTVREARKALKEYMTFYLTAMRLTKSKINQSKVKVESRISYLEGFISKSILELGKYAPTSKEYLSLSADITEKRLSLVAAKSQLEQYKKDLTQIDKDISEVEKYYPGDGKRGDRSTNLFNALVDTGISNIQQKFNLNKSVIDEPIFASKSGTARISQHMTSAPPEEESSIDYELARIMAQFLIKTRNMNHVYIPKKEKDDYGDVYYTISYIDSKYADEVDKFISKISTAVAPTDDLINGEMVEYNQFYDYDVNDEVDLSNVRAYSLIDRGSMARIAESFKIDLNPVKRPTNKKYSKSFMDSTPTKIKFILNSLYSAAYDSCIKFVSGPRRHKSTNKPTTDDLKQTNTLILNFIQFYKFFLGVTATKRDALKNIKIGGEATKKILSDKELGTGTSAESLRLFSGTVFAEEEDIIEAINAVNKEMAISLDYVKSNPAVYSYLGEDFINTKFSSDGKISLHQVVDTLYNAMPTRKNLGYIFSKNTANDLVLLYNLYGENLFSLTTIFDRMGESSFKPLDAAEIDRGIKTDINNRLNVIKSSIISIFDDNSKLNAIKEYIVDQKEKLLDSRDVSDRSFYKVALDKLAGDKNTLEKKIKDTADKLYKTVQRVDSDSVNIISAAYPNFGKRVNAVLVYASEFDISAIPDELPNYITDKYDDSDEDLYDLSYESSARSNQSSDNQVKIPDVYYLFIENAKAGPIMPKGPLVRGRKRSRSISTAMSRKKREQDIESRAEHIALYNSVGISKKEKEALNSISEDITEGRSPWFYVYLPITTSVKGRKTTSSLIGPLRKKEAFDRSEAFNQTSYRAGEISPSSGRRPFKVTLTKKDDLYRFRDLAELIDKADESSTKVVTIDRAIEINNKMEADIEYLNSVQIPKLISRLKAVAEKAVEYFRGRKDEFYSTIYSDDIEYVQLLSKCNRVDTNYSLLSFMSPDNRKKVRESIEFSDNFTQPSFLFSTPVFNKMLELGLSIYTSDQSETLLEVENGISAQSQRDRIAAPANIELAAPLSIILSTDVNDRFRIYSEMMSYKSYGVDITMNDFMEYENELITRLVNGVVDYLSKLGPERRKDINTLKNLKMSFIDIADALVRSKKILIDKIGEVNKYSSAVAEQISSFIGTRAIVIDIRKFIQAVGEDDTDKIADSMYVNSTTTVGQTGLNPLGVIGGLLHYQNNFMVVNYGSGKLMLNEDDDYDPYFDDYDGDDDDDSDRVSIGLNLYDAARQYYDIKQSGSKAGIFQLIMEKTTEYRNSKAYKFDPVRYWRHLVNKAYEADKESRQEGEEAIDKESIAEELDDRDDFDEIIKDSLYRAYMRGFYPNATKYIPVDEAASTKIRFFQSMFLPIFTSKVKDEYINRENPRSGARSMSSEIYILWFLEAYDAADGLDITSSSRIEMARKVTLEEMLKEGYSDHNGNLTTLGNNVSMSLVVTPWMRARFNAIKLDNAVTSKVNQHVIEMVRDNPRGYPLSAKQVKAKGDGIKDRFLSSTDPSDYLKAGSEVRMYRPKIVTGEGKYYRPRVYLTVDKNITLSDSNAARGAIRKKALSSVVLDKRTKRYVHSKKLGTTEANEPISFYLSPEIGGPVKEVAPVRRMKKSLGPRGKDLYTQANEFVQSTEVYTQADFPNLSGVKNNEISACLTIIHYYYIKEVMNSDNRTTIPESKLNKIAGKSAEYITADWFYPYFKDADTSGSEYSVLMKSLQAAIKMCNDTLNLITGLSDPSITARYTAGVQKLRALPGVNENLDKVGGYVNSTYNFVLGINISGTEGSKAKARANPTITINIEKILKIIKASAVDYKNTLNTELLGEP